MLPLWSFLIDFISIQLITTARITHYLELVHRGSVTHARDDRASSIPYHVTNRRSSAANRARTNLLPHLSIIESCYRRFTLVPYRDSDNFLNRFPVTLLVLLKWLS